MKDNGGSAFPHGDITQWSGSTSSRGITKREYFAAKAMQAYLSRGDRFLFCDAIDASIKAADYMIKQLQMKPTNEPKGE